MRHGEKGRGITRKKEVKPASPGGLETGTESSTRKRRIGETARPERGNGREESNKKYRKNYTGDTTDGEFIEKEKKVGGTGDQGDLKDK